MFRIGIITLACALNFGIVTVSGANTAHDRVGSALEVSAAPATTIVSESPANSIDYARNLFFQGEYEKARQAGEALGVSQGSAQGYALAAEAMSAQIMLGLLDKPHKQSKRAFALAQKAIALDPEDQDAIMQYTLTYGFVTRTSLPLTAWRKKYPMKSLALIEGLQTDFPEDPRADALLAAWHLGVVRKTGVKNGEKWFGARLDQGIELYESAIRRAPDDIIIHSHFALTRFVIDPENYAKETQELLEKIAAMPAMTAIDRDVQSRMVEILDNFDNPKVAIKKSENFLDSKARA